MELISERVKVDIGWPMRRLRRSCRLPVASPGITHLSHRGATDRQKIDFREKPLTLRVATDGAADRHRGMERAFGVRVGGPAGGGLGYQLKLFERPPGGTVVQRLNDMPLGDPLYTNTVYPGYYWYRQMVEVSKEWQGKPVVFVLGGCDRYDWRNYWAYLNGQRIRRIFVR